MKEYFIVEQASHVWDDYAISEDWDLKNLKILAKGTDLTGVLIPKMRSYVQAILANMYENEVYAKGEMQRAAEANDFFGVAYQGDQFRMEERSAKLFVSDEKILRIAIIEFGGDLI